MLAKLLHLVMHDVLRVKVVSCCRRTPRTAKLAQEQLGVDCLGLEADVIGVLEGSGPGSMDKDKVGNGLN